jgi:hypothetical protein
MRNRSFSAAACTPIRPESTSDARLERIARESTCRHELALSVAERTVGELANATCWVLRA